VELSTDDVVDALRGVGYDPNDVVAAGAGAWSSCFAFRGEGRDLVVRFGPYLEDFEKDRFAARFSCAAMPVPHVEMADAVGDGFLVVSARALGVPLEEVSRPEWERLVPAIVELLEALRTAEIPAGGFGGWDGAGIATDTGWPNHLLAVRGSTGDRRPADWYDRLSERPVVRAAFDAGYARLAGLNLSAAPRSLIHADLINRNVHVVDDHVTGVFDWGCGRYGDHLYDAAWFEFWAPFHPHLDIDLLLTQLRHRWTDAGVDISAEEPRRLACLLHIGLDHIAYNTTRAAWTDVDDVVARMHDLRLV
jgi:hygromycin-B 4-O-kinase